MANTEEQPIYLTDEGRRRLERRIQEYAEQLRRLQTPPAVDEARDTADEGTALEAADDAARVADQIALLQQTLRNARSLAPGPDDGIVHHGARVLVREGQGVEHWFKLLDAAELEDDPEDVSLDSPMGHALLGRARGDEVTAHLPNGTRRFTVLSVEPYRPG